MVVASVIYRFCSYTVEKLWLYSEVGFLPHYPYAIAIPPLLPEQPEDQRTSVLIEEDWGIVKLVDERWTGRDYGHKVC